MKSNIQKWGNSLGVRIPRSIAEELSLHSGITVEIKIEDDHIVIYPKKSLLSELVNKITEENRHALEWDNDNTRGSE